MNDEALHSLLDIDENYPTPRVNAFLAQPENRAFLEYVHKDPFGCHVFPGDLVDYPLAAFLPIWRPTFARRAKSTSGPISRPAAIAAIFVSTPR